MTTFPPPARPFTTMLVIVLIVLTLINGYALVRSGQLVQDGSEHGRDLDDLTMRLSALALTESILSLVCLVGVWLRQLWGVRLYAVVKVLALLLAFAVAADHVTPAIVVPVVVALLLWRAASSAGWQSDSSYR